MSKEQFTPDENENEIFERYLRQWHEWPAKEPKSPEERIDDLENFATSHEELLFDLYAKVGLLEAEIKRLRDGK